MRSDSRSAVSVAGGSAAARRSRGKPQAAMTAAIALIAPRREIMVGLACAPRSTTTPTHQRATRTRAAPKHGGCMALTLYHAAQSRSTRPRWLLEEIGVPYELVRLS